MNDIDILRQMYATPCGGIDAALTLLEFGNVWEAKKNYRPLYMPWRTCT